MQQLGLKDELIAGFAAAGRLPGNPLSTLAHRRELRSRILQAGWKRNAWVFLVSPVLFILAIVASASGRMDGWDFRSDDLMEMFRVLSMVVLIPAALLWLLGGLFRLSRDSLGWLSQIKDSGGAQMLDSMICISPMPDREMVLAGLRINVMPIWPRIVFAAIVFCGSFVLALDGRSAEIQLQGLLFLPLSIVAVSLSGILGSICLGLYLFLIGLNLRMHLLVPLIGLLLAGLQLLSISFGSVMFIELSGNEVLDMELWPLVPVGLAAGLLLFMGTVWLAFSGRNRQTWLLVVVPLMLPIVISFIFTIGNIVTGNEGEAFAAFFGNMMWVFNCFMPFSPFHAPTTMLHGAPVAEATTALVFEFWRWPLMLAMQLLLAAWLMRYAVQATRDRRTPTS